jgi:hypothetical protein
MEKIAGSKILNIQGVIDLGRALINTSNRYPMRFVTERDFFPLVVTYLSGRVPGLNVEVSTASGRRIDFRLMGNNSTWLEIAVQPRAFADMNFPNRALPGYARGSLRADQNRSELKKLIAEQRGKTRFLLLIDLNGGYDEKKLKLGYRFEAQKFSAGKPVRVVYVAPDRCDHFLARPRKATGQH